MRKRPITSAYNCPRRSHLHTIDEPLLSSWKHLREVREWHIMLGRDLT
jgi:hypothetical protein